MRITRANVATSTRRAPARRSAEAAALTVAPVSGRVLLVDDVYTTGATVNAAASALRRAGARRVEVATFARVIRIR
jgi:predicted amidophosphoribosyltransferase